MTNPIDENQIVDSSYFYNAIKQREDELIALKALIDRVPIEDMGELPGYALKAYKSLKEHIEVMASVFNTSSELKKLESQEGKQKLWNEVRKEHENKSQAEMMKALFNQTALIQIMQSVMAASAEELKIIRPYFQQSLIDHYNTTHNRQTKKNEKYDQDKRYMRQCLNRATNFGRSAVDPEHYLPFRKYVIECYKPSSMNGEIEAVTEGDDHGWSEGTMRKFFEEETGEKPTSL